MNKLKTNGFGFFYVVVLAGIICVFSQCQGGGGEQEQSGKVSGKVVKILDGDTYDLLLGDNIIIRVRMNGIDAPEKSMPFGRKSRQFLKHLCEGEIITVDTTQRETFNRFISSSYLEDGRELGQEMLKAGLAWHFKNYNSNPKLSDLEDSARINKVGLWVERPYILPPWIVRKQNRQGYKTKDIYKAQQEHLKGQHTKRCPDLQLCEIIKEENWYN